MRTLISWFQQQRGWAAYPEVQKLVNGLSEEQASQLHRFLTDAMDDARAQGARDAERRIGRGSFPWR